jgi:uncharacterized delta-60 repeat protein
MPLNSNTRTLTADEIKTASGSYTIAFPSNPPLSGTSLSYNGVNYVWSASGGGGGLPTQVSLNTNQVTPANTGVSVDALNATGFNIDYSVERKFDSLSEQLTQSIMDNVGITDIGKFTTFVRSVILQPDGKIIVVGDFFSYNRVIGRNLIVRFNSDGTTDTTFCVNASDGAKFANGAIRSVALQSDGKILLGGSFTAYNGTTNRDRLIRLNADGTLDTAFCANASDGAKINATVLSIFVQSDGKILIGGSFTNYAGTVGRSYLVRLNSDGTTDTAFCVNASDSSKFQAAVNVISAQSDGKILVGGAFNNYSATTNRNKFLRLNSDGTTDTAFCANAVDSAKFSNDINTIALQSDNKIILGGTFASYAGTTGRSRLIRLNSDGTLDTAFCVNATDGTKFSNEVNTVALRSDGKILLGGSFTNYSSVTGRNRLILLNSDGTTDTAFCTNASDGAKFGATINTAIFATGSEVFIGGNFTSYGTTEFTRYFVALNSDGSINNTLNSNISGTVFSFSATATALARQSDGKILVGGLFTNYKGQLNRSYLIRLNSDGTTDTAFCANAVDGAKFNAQIFSITVQSDGKILVGGLFTNYDGITGRSYLVRLNSDGTLDTAFCANAVDSAKFNAQATGISVQSDGKILVGGNFTNYAGTTNRNRLIRLNSDGTLDTAFCVNASDGAKVSAGVNIAFLQSDGKILLAGNFSNYAGTSGRSRLVRLNADGTTDTAFCVNAVDGAKFNAEVNSVFVQSDGKILAGGAFNDYAGTAGRNRLVRLNADGTTDTAFCVNAVDGTKFGSEVTSCVAQLNGKILIGGSFTNYAGTTNRSRLLLLNNDGTIDVSFANSAVDGKFASGSITNNCIIVDSSYNVYFSGNFSLVAPYQCYATLSPQLYGGIVQSQLEMGRIQGLISVSGTITTAAAYAPLGSSGVTFSVNSSGNIQYTSNNTYPYPDYQQTYGYARLLVGNF